MVVKAWADIFRSGKIIDIEGNYDSPINEGTLCPKVANTFQLTVNPHRIKKVLYRAPFSMSLRQNGVGTGSTSADAILPKGHSKRAFHAIKNGVML